MTLIGNPPNLVKQNTLTSAGLEPLSFFSFLPVGIVCVIVGTLVLMPLSKWLLSKKGRKDVLNLCRLIESCIEYATLCFSLHTTMFILLSFLYSMM